MSMAYCAYNQYFTSFYPRTGPGTQFPRTRRRSGWGRRRRQRRGRTRSAWIGHNKQYKQYNLDNSDDNYHYFFLLQVLVDLSDEEGGEDEGGSKPKKEEPEDLGIPNVAVRIPLETAIWLMSHLNREVTWTQSIFQVGTPPPTASGNPADIECIDIEWRKFVDMRISPWNFVAVILEKL